MIKLFICWYRMHFKNINMENPELFMWDERIVVSRG